MKRIFNILLSRFSFAAIIFLQVISTTFDGDLELLHPWLAGALFALAVNLVLLQSIKSKDYFPYGITFVYCIGYFSLFIYPPLEQWFLHNFVTSLYIGLFLSAAVPPIFSWKPFSYHYSAHKYPDVIVRSEQFKKNNLIITWIWAVLFVGAAILSSTHFSDDKALQFYLSVFLPIAIQVCIGIPAIIFIPKLFTNRTRGPKLDFRSLSELFEALPLGLNRKKAIGVNEVIQFCFSDEEQMDGYITIQEQKCSFTLGISKEPTIKIVSDSKLWLEISNGAVSGQKAMMDGKYTIEGNLSFMTKFDELFSTVDVSKTLYERVYEFYTRMMKRWKTKQFIYKSENPGEIQNILVINGSTRGSKLSKSAYMARQFVRGAVSAGATSEWVSLIKHNLEFCNGCYSCFSKTPGVCSKNDDMKGLLSKIENADLLVFVSPLYYFSISGLLKTFIDRMLPLVKPDMEIIDNVVIHPYRKKDGKFFSMIIFSAGGFPEVAGNFDGISALFRIWHNHSLPTGGLMGEFYLPAAEMIVQPAYRTRKEKIAKACKDAGVQVVEKGKIDSALMEIVADPGVSKEVFQSQANNFWESLSGHKAYLKVTPQLDLD